MTATTLSDSEGRTSAAANGYAQMVAQRRRVGVEGPRRALRFDEFRQVVRRTSPSALLPALAAPTLGSGAPFERPTNLEACPPWAVALAARESILWSNEHRRATVNAEDLRLIFNAHNEIYDGKLPGVSEGVLGILTRLAFEQFPYGESIFEEVSRTHAMMVDHAAGLGLEVLGDDAAWEQMLGMPLGPAVGATFFLQVAASENAGWFDPSWLDGHEFADVLEYWPREVITKRLSDLSFTVDEFKKDYARMPKPAPGLERYAYNPLTRRPFVVMPNGTYLAPQPRLILRTITSGGLFQLGRETLGKPFPRDLGVLVESYVGRQLSTLTEPAEVSGEVVYGPENVKSIDWFVVFPSLVVMFEVKSARFGLLERAGMKGFEERSKKLLDRAVGQLETTSRALHAGQPELAHIPADRPRVGVVVTAEPHYLANSPWIRDVTATAAFPTLVASVREIEALVTLGAQEVERQLTEIVSDPERSTWNLANALTRADTGSRNVLLEAAWRSYPLAPGPDPDGEEAEVSLGTTAD